MVDCPCCDYTTTPEMYEGSQEELKEHLLSKHRDEIRRKNVGNPDTEKRAAAMAENAIERSYR